MTGPVLEIDNLHTCFFTYKGMVRAVDGVSLTVGRGETVALVGESGCGKSVTALSIMRLVPPPGRIVGGRVLLDGDNLLEKPAAGMRRIRGRRMGMVFQDPLSALNPTLTVGHQIVESLKAHGIARGKEAQNRGIELLDAMGIPAADQRFDAYPHELSGGMRQRIVIAIAVACDPDLLIADEPTTALDVTLQAQILDLLARLKEDRGLAVLLITHDLGIVSEFADRAAVMYAGQIVEEGRVEDIIREPLHPYTQGLMGCVPRLDRPDLEIAPIEGSLPDMAAPPKGCRFASRCPYVMDRCLEAMPSLIPQDSARLVRCHLYDDPCGVKTRKAWGAEQ